MSRNRSRNSLQNTFKDYFVPIVGGVIVIILIFSMFGGNDQENTIVAGSENQNPVAIQFVSEGTEAFIMYPGDERKQIQSGAEFYKGESVIVKEGIVNLAFGNNNTISLNKVAELKYNEDASISLYSSDAWIKLAENTEISMRYANIESPSGSILSLTQNEASSTVYVLDGSAKVTNLGGASTALIAGQKLSIARQFAADENADISSDKGPIDSYFKSSDWFIENEGHLTLSKIQASGEENISGSGSDSQSGESGVFLRFDTLRDESSIDQSQIDISGEILSDSVELITINGTQAQTSSDNSFSVEGISTSLSINDIVIKIYDENRSILDKKVITIYNTNPSSANSGNQTNSSVQTAPSSSSTNSQGVTTFGVDATNFSFTQPSASGKFSTTAGEITIRGLTTAENISKVEVNGFELASFNGSTWRYHAFERFETLEAGTNQYKVDYFGEDGNIVYTDYYTIVKRSPESENQTTESEPESSSAAEELENQESTEEIPPEEDLFQ